MPSVSTSVKGNPLLAPLSGREWATSYEIPNVGDRITPGIKNLPLSSANGLPGWRMSGYGSEKLLFLRMRN